MSDWIPTTCMRCAVGCGHLQRGADIGNGIDTVRGDAAHPVNQGLACQRGVDETQDPDGEWLTRPLVRRNGDLKSTTWDVALSEALEAFRDADAAGEVAVLGSGQQTNEAAYALGKLARGGFGTPYYDANTTLCMASAVTAYYQAFGSDAPPCTYEDIEDAQAHVIWGANPATAHPVLFRWIRQAAGSNDADIVVVDPVETGTAKDADAHVAPDPGHDLSLARAVLARLVETDRLDDAFIATATEGFDDLRVSLPDSTEAAAASHAPRARWTCSSVPNTPKRRYARSSSCTTRRGIGRTARRTGRGSSSTTGAPRRSARHSTSVSTSRSRPPGPTSVASTPTTPASPASGAHTTTSASTTRKTASSTSA